MQWGKKSPRNTRKARKGAGRGQERGRKGAGRGQERGRKGAGRGQEGAGRGQEGAGRGRKGAGRRPRKEGDDTISVYWVVRCRGVSHTPLPHPRGCSSLCSISHSAAFVSFGEWSGCPILRPKVVGVHCAEVFGFCEEGVVDLYERALSCGGFFGWAEVELLECGGAGWWEFGVGVEGVEGGEKVFKRKGCTRWRGCERYAARKDRVGESESVGEFAVFPCVVVGFEIKEGKAVLFEASDQEVRKICAGAIAQGHADVSEGGEGEEGDIGEGGLGAWEGFVFFGERAVTAFDGVVGGDILVNDEELGFSAPSVEPCEAVLCGVGDDEVFELCVATDDTETLCAAGVDAYKVEGGLGADGHEGQSSRAGLCSASVFDANVAKGSAVVVHFVTAVTPAVCSVILTGGGCSKATVLGGVTVEKKSSPVACFGGG